MHQDVPDYLRPGLKLVLVGINPGLRSGATGHHYAYPGNHFWPLLYQSGLLPEPLTFAEDARVLEFDIGLTNLCERTSREASELTREELAAGAANLRRKLLDCHPGVACFNGMGIYETFLICLNEERPPPSSPSPALPTCLKEERPPRSSPSPALPRRKSVKPGLQADKLGETLLFVVPSSSGRTAAYPRQVKLEYFRQLKQLVDSLPVESPA